MYREGGGLTRAMSVHGRIATDLLVSVSAAWIYSYYYLTEHIHVLVLFYP
jgi:hypothetical protein